MKKFVSWNIDSLNAALTSDSGRAIMSRLVLDTLVKEDADGFPLPPKHKIFGNMVNCLKVRNFEIAYLEQRRNPDDDKKHRNRNLYRYIMGQKIKEVRELSGMTLEELAEKSGYRPNNIRNIEMGRFNC